MKPDEIVAEAKEKYSEWLEMAPNPDEILVGVFSIQIWSLKNEVEYLRKCLSRYTNYV